MLSKESPLQILRTKSPIPFPKWMEQVETLSLKAMPTPSPLAEIESSFPHLAHKPLLDIISSPSTPLPPLRIGAVFSGGQAPGGHNVLCGLFDALEQTKGTLIGFLGGPSGLIDGRYQELSKENLSSYRNMGGFDLLGSGRTKIETKEQQQKALSLCLQLHLDGLVIIGGDDSNTNAAVLAEFFEQNSCTTKVIGVPKTIDGDLQNAFVPISFGFDTASKIYSELISNLAKDALSDRKYYHIIKLMGRTASHVTLECALMTHPNYTLIAEEVFQKKLSLSNVVSDLCDLIVKRFEAGKSYGVLLIPEGLLEWVVEVQTLIQELNALLAKQEALSIEEISPRLTSSSQECFTLLPLSIQKQLLSSRDPHGNVPVSSIETEKLLIELIQKELQKRSFPGQFHPVPHFFGYEGRSGFPSLFDAAYCYTLGLAAFTLIAQKANGYMAFVSHLHLSPSDWKAGGVPLASLLHREKRGSSYKPVIQKALVRLDHPAFLFFAKERENWRVDDCYRCVGPIQFPEGHPSCLDPPMTLSLNQGDSLH